MKEYIEREAVIDLITRRYECPEICTAEINSIPTADVVERKQGRWIEHEWAEEENGLLISNFECSMCHIWERKKSDFCPNCGADMREGVDPCTE